MQGLVHRTAISDLDQTLTLGRTQFAIHVNQAINTLHKTRLTRTVRTILGMDPGMMQLHPHTIERQPLWLATIRNVMLVHVPRAASSKS
jgi:hypothetical protein